VAREAGPDELTFSKSWTPWPQGTGPARQALLPVLDPKAPPSQPVGVGRPSGSGSPSCMGLECEGPDDPAPQVSHLQITPFVELDHSICCTTKSLPPIMEPEEGEISRQKSWKSKQQVPRPKQVGWQEQGPVLFPQRREQLSWAPGEESSEHLAGCVLGQSPCV
jgi:hypothetical protein